METVLTGIGMLLGGACLFVFWAFLPNTHWRKLEYLLWLFLLAAALVFLFVIPITTGMPSGIWLILLFISVGLAFLSVLCPKRAG